MEGLSEMKASKIIKYTILLIASFTAGYWQYEIVNLLFLLPISILSMFVAILVDISVHGSNITDTMSFNETFLRADRVRTTVKGYLSFIILLVGLALIHFLHSYIQYLFVSLCLFLIAEPLATIYQTLRYSKVFEVKIEQAKEREKEYNRVNM